MPSRHEANSNRVILDPNLETDSCMIEQKDSREILNNERYLPSILPQVGHFGKGPKGYTRSDERIMEDVCEVLTRSYDVDATNIEVDVKGGCVYLKGEVDTREMKSLAEDCVENISGVVDVQNRLIPKSSAPKIRLKISVPENEHGTRLS